MRPPLFEALIQRNRRPQRKLCHFIRTGKESYLPGRVGDQDTGWIRSTGQTASCPTRLSVVSGHSGRDQPSDVLADFERGGGGRGGSVADVQAALVGDDVKIIDERAIRIQGLGADSGRGRVGVGRGG